MTDTMHIYSLDILHVSPERADDTPTRVGKPVQVSGNNRDEVLDKVRAHAKKTGHLVTSVNFAPDNKVVVYVTDAGSNQRSAAQPGIQPVWRRPPGPKRM